MSEHLYSIIRHLRDEGRFCKYLALTALVFSSVVCLVIYCLLVVKLYLHFGTGFVHIVTVVVSFISLLLFFPYYFVVSSCFQLSQISYSGF